MLTRIAGILGRDYRFLLPFNHPFGGLLPDSLRVRRKKRLSLLPVVPGSEDIPREMKYANHEARFRQRL